MSALTLLWTAAVGLLIGGATVALEAALRHRRLPARGVWAAALLVTLTAPWWGPALAEVRTGNRGAAEWVLPLGPAEAGATEAAEPMPSFLGSALARLAATSRGLPTLWALVAGLALLLVAAAMVRLQRRLARLPRARVGGDEVTLAPDFGPACVGVGQPRIVLPRWILALDRKALDLVLRHERSHGDAHDPLLLAAGLVAVALAPWNPALWWQMVRLRKAVELDCDRRVLASGASPGAYGRVLLAVIGRERGLMAFPAPALLESTSFLERRLTLMNSRLRIPPHRTALALALAAGLGALACETPAPTALSPAERLETDADVQAVMETIEIEGVGRVPANAVIIVDGNVATAGEVFDATQRVSELVRRYEVDGRVHVEIRTVEPSSEAQEKRPFTVREVTGVGRPLIVVDGVVTGNVLGDLSALDVASIEVIKGAAAEALYGPRGKAGVVSIRTRAGAPAEGRVPFVRDEDGQATRERVRLDPEVEPVDPEALVILDGVIMNGGIAELRRLMDDDPNRFASIEVVKGAAAAELYGSRARSGVIRVTSRR